MFHINKNSILTAAVSAASGLLMPIVTMAATESGGSAQLEEVVVTAQKRDESLTNVSASIVAFKSEQLEALGIRSVADLAKVVPGMRIDFSGGFMQPTVRGIGSAIAGTGMSANVATYVDGYYSPTQLTTDSLFLNLKSVNVLKGPQGTLFGRNATGGAILMSLRDPTTTPTLEVKLSEGRFNKREAALYGSTGFSEHLAVDASVVYAASDGFTDNVVTGQKGVDGYDNWSARISALWKPTDAMSFKFAYQHSAVKDGRPYAFNVIVNPLSGRPAAIADTLGSIVPTERGQSANGSPTLLRTNVNGVYLTSTFDLGFATLTSYTQYRKESVENQYDGDASPLPLQGLLFVDDNKTFTEELNLHGAGDRLDYVLGAFFMRERETQDPFTLTVAQLIPVFGENVPYYATSSNIRAWAAFADATYKLTDKWFLIGGVRYSDERSEASYTLQTLGALFAPGALANSGVPFNNSWTNFTPRAGVRYNLTDKSNVYLTFSQGFKAGLLTPNAFITTPLEPEKVSAGELGYKYGGPRNRFEAAIYYYDYKNLQVANYVNGSAIYQNAAAAKIYGADVSSTSLLTDDLTLNIGVAYTHARYSDYPNASAWSLSNIGLSSQFAIPNAKDFQMQRAPDWTGNLGLVYAIPLAGGKLSLSGDYYYTSRFPFDNAQVFYQEAYGLLGLRAAWTDASKRREFAIFGTNVLDKKYNSSLLPGIPAIERNYGEPAVVGGSVAFKF